MNKIEFINERKRYIHLVLLTEFVDAGHFKIEGGISEIVYLQYNSEQTEFTLLNILNNFSSTKIKIYFNGKISIKFINQNDKFMLSNRQVKYNLEHQIKNENDIFYYISEINKEKKTIISFPAQNKCGSSLMYPVSKFSSYFNHKDFNLISFADSFNFGGSYFQFDNNLKPIFNRLISKLKEIIVKNEMNEIDIIFTGISKGASITSMLMSEFPKSSYILVAPIAHFRGIKKWYMYNYLKDIICKYPFNNLTYDSKVFENTILIYGTHDYDSNIDYFNFKCKKVILPEGNHLQTVHLNMFHRFYINDFLGKTKKSHYEFSKCIIEVISGNLIVQALIKNHGTCEFAKGLLKFCNIETGIVTFIILNSIIIKNDIFFELNLSLRDLEDQITLGEYKVSCMSINFDDYVYSSEKQILLK